MQKQNFHYNELIVLKSIKAGSNTTIGYRTIHYVALDITLDNSNPMDKQYIFCAIYDKVDIVILTKEKTYSPIHHAFVAYWNDRGYDNVQESLDFVLSLREYQFSFKSDESTGKLLIKLESNPGLNTNDFLPIYSDKDVKEILQWIDDRSHSDDER